LPLSVLALVGTLLVGSLAALPLPVRPAGRSLLTVLSLLAALSLLAIRRLLTIRLLLTVRARTAVGALRVATGRVLPLGMAPLARGPLRVLAWRVLALPARLRRVGRRSGGVLLLVARVPWAG
jgi:hypothetical protein